MLSGLAGPRPSSKLRYFVLEVLVEEMPFHGNFSHIVNVFGKTSTEKKTFSFGHCPNHLNPPPDPNSGNLVFFSDVKIQDLKVT